MNKTELINKIYSKIVKILDEDLSDSDIAAEDEDVSVLASDIELMLEHYILGD